MKTKNPINLFLLIRNYQVDSLKQKAAFFLSVVVAALLFYACSGDDEPTGKGKLPETARVFIESRLPGYTILRIDEVDDKGDEMNEKYIVSLPDDITVTFSSLGFWRRLESTGELPRLLQEVLSYGGADAVKAAYPSRSIRMIHFKYYGCMAVLDDGTKLAFYDITRSNTFGTDLTDTPLLWPEASRDLIRRYYMEEARNNPCYFIQEGEKDGVGYRFSTTQSTVCFDKTGDWYAVDGGSFSIPSGIAGVLPESSNTLLIDQYGLGKGRIITALVRHEAYYLVLLTNEYNRSPFGWLMFDKQTGLQIEAPKQKAIDFLKEYVGDPSDKMEFESEIKTDSKHTAFCLRGIVDNKVVLVMYMDIDGKMLSLSLQGATIPHTVLSYLPVAVKEYAEANYGNREIQTVVNGLDGMYFIQYAGNFRFYFNQDGNVTN